MKPLLASLTLLLCTALCNAQSIILLNGTSSAGKSSIAKALQNMLQPSHVKITGEDNIVHDVIYEILQERGYALDPNQSIDEWNSQLPQNFELHEHEYLPRIAATLENMPSYIKQCAASNDYVIVDSVLCKKTETATYATGLTDAKVLNVLVYCPPATLINHVEQRNATERLEEYRPTTQVLKQFFKMYDMQQNKDGACIDTLKVQELEALMDKYCTNTSAEEANDAKKIVALYRTKSTNTNNIAYITPASFLTYDLVVNTGIDSAEECAQQIVAALNTKTN